MKNKIVNREEWKQQRIELLKKEKEFTKIRDELSKARRALPWVKIEKSYTFQSSDGPIQLGDLFEGKSQLVVYHFMFGPDWEQGCKSCSFWADHYDKLVIHLKHRDVNLIGISNGPLKKLQAFKKRMGWSFNWVSALGSDFNYDFHVSVRGDGVPFEYNYRQILGSSGNEWPGISVFYKDEEGAIYHTYSTYARGLEDFNTAYRYLDIVPKGRDEDDLKYGMEWVKLRDQY